MGGNLPAKTLATLSEIQKANTEQVIKLFDKAQPDSELTVAGKQIEQFLGIGGSNKPGTTKVFASQDLTDQEIINFAQSLAGNVQMEERKTTSGMIYIAQKEGCPTIKLRDFSSSEDKTNARWTIEIEGNKIITDGVGEKVKRVEIKFR